MGKFFTGIPLTLWPKISVVVFLVLFLAIMIVTWWPSSRIRAERAARLPFDDE